MNTFSSGPFQFTPGRALRAAGTPSRLWTMSYSTVALAERTIAESASQSDVLDAFGEDRSAFVSGARVEHAPARVELIDLETGDAVAHFESYDACGMTPGLIDDRSRYWIRSADRRRSRSVTLSEFAMIAAEHAAPAHSWIAGLLADATLTQDVEAWRAPTGWEIRHVVGEGSFSGVSGARAAALVGVTPQNFRKYTARDDASTRQSMSYAMWHLLLHKLGVVRA